MEKAISEVERLENLPLPYQEKLPREDLSGRFFATALALLVLLIVARSLEVNEWNA
jgi:mxaC protein